MQFIFNDPAVNQKFEIACVSANADALFNPTHPTWPKWLAKMFTENKKYSHVLQSTHTAPPHRRNAKNRHSKVQSKHRSSGPTFDNNRLYIYIYCFVQTIFPDYSVLIKIYTKIIPDDLLIACGPVLHYIVLYYDRLNYHYSDYWAFNLLFTSLLFGWLFGCVPKHKRKNGHCFVCILFALLNIVFRMVANAYYISNWTLSMTCLTISFAYGFILFVFSFCWLCWVSIKLFVILELKIIINIEIYGNVQIVHPFIYW